jgi:tetratricopeptide (TPR) repeat protein
MNSDILHKVALAKSTASAKRDLSEKIESKNNPKRQDLIKSAIKDLERLTEDLTNWLSKSSSDNLLRHSVKAELADTYGMLGGLYRRLEELDKSIEMYKLGKDIEVEGLLESTYNRVNYIVLTVLQNPESLAEESTLQLIGDTANIVQRQVDGTRYDQWWAWADLGQLYLLSGKNYEATKSYRNFIPKVNSRALVSHLNVLRSLQAALQGTKPDIAHMIVRIIEELSEYTLNT